MQVIHEIVCTAFSSATRVLQMPTESLRFAQACIRELGSILQNSSAYLFNATHLDGDCRNFFDSALYDEVKSQWLKIAAECGLDINIDSSLSPKEWFQALYKQLNETNNVVSKSFQARCYLETNLTPTQLLNILPIQTDGSLKEIYMRLSKSPMLGYHGNVRDLFNAHYFGNVPFNIGQFSFDTGQSFKMIRMPSVTRDVERDFLSRTTEVEIIPGFMSFIESLGADETHLYVNLMSGDSGNEALRTETINSLNSEKIVVLTLDKDSDFYKQKGIYGSAVISRDDFIEQFLEHIEKVEKIYSLPSNFDGKTLKKIIQSVTSSHTLSILERQNFIEEAYCKIIEAVAKECSITSMNLSCKHCIDRGAGQNAAFLNYLEKEHGQVIPEELLKAILFVPAVMVSNRPLKQHYFMRALQFINRGES